MESNPPVSRVVTIVGTRPEAIKMIPVIHELQRRPFVAPFVLATGQHRDSVAPLFAQAGITIDAELELHRRGSDLSELIIAVMEGTSQVLTSLKSDDPTTGLPFTAAVMVHGDTSSAMAGAVAAMAHQIPVMHVEAGLRTRDWWQPWPEELNRQIIGRIAAMHYAPTTTNLGNLIREAISEKRTLITGNTGIDALMWATAQPAVFEDERIVEMMDASRKLVVVTAHRRESWGAGLDGVAAGVAAAALELGDVNFVVPMHPNPKVRESLQPALRDIPNVTLTEPLDYVPFAHLLKRADLVVTDSGGIQEEAPSFDVPVLVCREETERKEGVDAGTLLLVGTDRDVIRKNIVNLLTDPAAYLRMADSPNPYGDGKASLRIGQSLAHLARLGPPPIPFGPGYSRTAVLEAAGYGRYVRAGSYLRPEGWLPPEQGEWFDEPESLKDRLEVAYHRFSDAQEPPQHRRNTVISPEDAWHALRQARRMSDPPPVSQMWHELVSTLTPGSLRDTLETARAAMDDATRRGPLASGEDDAP